MSFLYLKDIFFEREEFGPFHRTSVLIIHFSGDKYGNSVLQIDGATNII